MRPIYLLVTALCLLPFMSRAQDSTATNAPATEIENFELQNDAVIVKGYDDIGSVTTEAGVISVICKESDNITAGNKLYGLAVTLRANEARTSSVVDYDEVDGFIHSLDFIGKISYNVTTMPSFDAGFTTKSGLRISAHSERREGGIQVYLQFGNMVRIPLNSVQFVQFQTLINQAKTSLDATKNKNSST